MKLKKLVSLALAGVLAVSMLAGCKANGNSSSSEQPATGVNAATVIAALDKKVTDKVTFTPSASLQTTLDKVVQYKGATGATKITNEDLLKFDSKLNKNWQFAEITEKTTEDQLKDATSITYVVYSMDVATLKESAVVNELAAAIEDAEVYKSGDKTISSLPTYTKDYGTVGKDAHFYNFKYTGEVAVSEVTDVVQNTTSYVLAFTITRTPVSVAR